MFCRYSEGVAVVLMFLLFSTFSDCKGESKGLEGGKKYVLSDSEKIIATCEECGPSIKSEHSVFCCNSNDVLLALMIPSTDYNDDAAKETPKESGCKGLEGGRKYLISDIGKMLARCHDCGTSDKFHQESVTVHGNRHDLFAQFTFEPMGDNKCAIKSDIEYYVAECNECWKNGNYSVSVFNHVELPCPESSWMVEKYGDFYAFKGNSGKYMARCRGCVPHTTTDDVAFVFASTPIDSALWTVISV